MDIKFLQENYPQFVCTDADGKATLDIVKIVDLIEDLNDGLTEKDYQINYLMKEIDKLKARIAR